MWLQVFFRILSQNVCAIYNKIAWDFCTPLRNLPDKKLWKILNFAVSPRVSIWSIPLVMNASKKWKSVMLGTKIKWNFETSTVWLL